MDKQSDFGWGWDRDTRSNRMNTICEILERQPGLTMRMIATRLGLKKTPYVRSMIIDLMEDDRVHYRWSEMTNGARCMVFYPGIDRTAQEDYERSLTDEDKLSAQAHERAVNESGFPSVAHHFDPDWPLRHADPMFTNIDDGIDDSEDQPDGRNSIGGFDADHLPF